MEATVIASMLGCEAESRNMYFTITRNGKSSPMNVAEEIEGLLTQVPTTQSNSVTLVFSNYVPMMKPIHSAGVSTIVFSIVTLFSLLAVYAF